MIKLEIKNSDGSHYWTEYFNKLEDAEKWMAEEKTRPYWISSRTHEFIDMSPPPKTKEEIDKDKAKEEQSRNRKSILKILAQKQDLTTVELKQAVELLIHDLYG